MIVPFVVETLPLDTYSSRAYLTALRQSHRTDVCMTVVQKRDKKQIEERLAEIEDALRIFSQRRVLVKADEQEEGS